MQSLGYLCSYLDQSDIIISISFRPENEWLDVVAVDPRAC